MSIASMSAISIDRYYAICKPMKTTRTISKRRSKRIIMAVWLYCLAWSVPPLVGFGSYSREGYGLSCTFDYVDQSFVNSIFVAMLFVTDFFLPLAIIIGCYTKIVFTVRAHNKEMKKVVDNKLEDTLKLKKLKNEKKEFKIAKIGMIMTSLFCIAWLPYASVSFIAQFVDPSIVNPFLQTMPVVCAKSSSVLNPIVYAITHEKFKTALTKRFLQNCCGSYEKEVAARERSQNIHQRAQFRRTAESSISAVVETSITTQVSEDPPPNPEENKPVKRSNFNCQTLVKTSVHHSPEGGMYVVSLTGEQ
ncbi:rhodopsin, GQ-coupled-like [Antedon mediterranea]|uniref:rhodopsin, GQ-coupled-like n=1 Tax=Antedon mediterranea TaxID=105859 RepID=UPI003AF60D50